MDVRQEGWAGVMDGGQEEDMQRKREKGNTKVVIRGLKRHVGAFFFFLLIFFRLI